MPTGPVAGSATGFDAPSRRRRITPRRNAIARRRQPQPHGLDEQSLHGKAPVGVASVARRNGTAVAAVAGRNLLSANALRAYGIQAACALTDIEPDPAVCMSNAAALLNRLGRRIAGDPPTYQRPTRSSH